MCSIFLIKPQSQTTVVFAEKYQLKRVIIAILNCTSFQFILPYEQKRKIFKTNKNFYRNNKIFCSIKTYNMCLNAVFWHRRSPTIVLPLVYCPVDNMFFEVGPKMGSSGV